MKNKEALGVKLKLEGLALVTRDDIKRELGELHRRMVNCAEATESLILTDNELVALVDMVSANVAYLAQHTMALVDKAATLQAHNTAIRMLNQI